MSKPLAQHLETLGLRMKNKDISKVFEQMIRSVGSASNRRLLAKRATNIIYKRVKSGYGVNKEGLDVGLTKKNRLKKLSDLYIKQRQGKIYVYTDTKGRVRVVKRKKATPMKLGRYGTPRRSNLTLTGQMLEALSYKVGGGNVQISVKGTRRKGSPLNNKKLAKLVSEQGRPWLALTNSEWKVLQKRVRSFLTKEIQKFF